MSVLRMATILLSLIGVACGEQDSVSRLSAVFDYENSQYKSLIYNDPQSNYEYVICRNASVMYTLNDCIEKQVLINFGDESRFINSILKILQQNVLGLPGDLAYHVAQSSEILRLDGMNDLLVEGNQLEQTIKELDRKIEFLKMNQYSSSSDEAKRNVSRRELHDLNEELAAVHPSGQTLQKRVDELVAIVRSDNYIGSKKISNPYLREMYQVVIGPPRVENDPIYYDDRSGRIWKVAPSKVVWKEGKHLHGPTSCSEYYGEAWSSPTRKQLQEAQVNQVIRNRKIRVPFNTLDTTNTIFDVMPSGLSEEKRHLVCASLLAQAYPNGDINYDGIKNIDE